jgi:hypothetical protein
VFDRLIAAGFTVRCDKVYLAQKQVPYLGFMCGGDGIRPLAAKTAAILELSCADMQHNPAAAARYAGMLGHYHRFLPGLHTILAPFHDLKQKGASAPQIMGSLRFKCAFEYTKHCLANVTALARPDYNKDFYLDVDTASSVGIGGVLSQRDDPDDPESHRPLAAWSRRLADEERRYGVRDQECLGLVEALENWRSFCLGARTIVRTDHKSLKWLLRTPHRDGTRVAGFALRAQGFDIDIEYVPHSQHGVADFFSRAVPPSAPSSRGGGERGELPPFRENIEDRLEEADAVTPSDSRRSFHHQAQVATISLHQASSVSPLPFYLKDQQARLRGSVQAACEVFAVRFVVRLRGGCDDSGDACHVTEVNTVETSCDEDAGDHVCDGDTGFALSKAHSEVAQPYCSFDAQRRVSWRPSWRTREGSSHSLTS